jgi:Flp pilus assembly pilin Flp
MLFAFKLYNARGIVAGQGLVEYALLIALVALIVIAALYFFGPNLGGVFSTVDTSLSSV